MNDLIAMYKEQGLTLVIDEAHKIARCERPAPRSRLGFKNEFYTRYQSVERMVLVCTQFIEKRIARSGIETQHIGSIRTQNRYVGNAADVGDDPIDIVRAEQPFVKRWHEGGALTAD